MNTKTFNESMSLLEQNLLNFDIENKAAYANFLAQTYYYVSHSTRLLAFAAGMYKGGEEKLFRRYISHISEESSHEVLALKDLEDLGYTIEQFPEIAETKQLWEAQYYKVLHTDPTVFMGYILALEAFACNYFPSFLEKIDKTYNGKAMRFVKLHAEEDPEHVKKAIEFIDSLEEERQSNISENILQTAKSYSYMLNACSETVC